MVQACGWLRGSLPYGANFDFTKKQYEQTFLDGLREMSHWPPTARRNEIYLSKLQKEIKVSFPNLFAGLTLFLVWNMIDTDLVPSVSEEAVEHTIAPVSLGPPGHPQGKVGRVWDQDDHKGAEPDAKDPFYSRMTEDCLLMNFLNIWKPLRFI